MKRNVAFVAILIALLAVLSACSTPTSSSTQTSPPAITSFTSNSITGGAAFQWSVTGSPGPDLTCALDTNGDGHTDETVASCGSVTSQSALFAIPGMYSSKLEVIDGQGRTASATTTTIAAGTSATPATWATQFGSVGNEYAGGVATDASGNAVVVGYTDGALPTYSNLGGTDIVLAKYDTNGTQLWATQFGTTGNDQGNGVATDANGDAYLVGYTDGALPTHLNLGSNDIVLAKYDPNGTQLWTKQPGTTGNDQGYGVTTDANGDAVLVGYTDGAWPPYSNAGGQDILLAKYDPNGTNLWTTQFGTSGNDQGYGVTTDANGNIIIVGATTGSLPNHSNAGGNDILLAKFDSNGNQLWATQFGTPAYDVARGVTIDANGNITLVGTTMGSLPNHATAGTYDVVLAKYDPNGSQLWATQSGTAGDDFGMGITRDAKGNTTLVGTTDGIFPGVTNEGGGEILLASFDPSGSQLWVRDLGTGGNELGFGIAGDSEGNTILVGHTNGALSDFPNLGGYDIVVAKYRP